MGSPGPGPLSSPARRPILFVPSAPPWRAAVGFGVALLALLPAAAAGSGPWGSAPPAVAPDPGPLAATPPPGPHGVAMERLPGASPSSPTRTTGVASDPRSIDPPAAVPANVSVNWYNATPASPTRLPTIEFTEGTWDRSDGYLLVYGGDNFAQNLAGTWTYRAGQWNETIAQGLPGALSGANLAFDANESRVIMFGGVRSFAPLHYNNTTYGYSAGTWSALSPTDHPTPRLAGSMVYDPSLGGVVLFGGANLSSGGTTYLNDLWLYKAGNWSKIPVTTAPPARWLAQMAYDPNSASILLYGGLDATGHTLADTWIFTSGNWTHRTVTGTLGALAAGAMDYDPSLGAVVLTGGQDSTGAFPRLSWTFNGSAWNPLTTLDLPTIHEAGIGVYDPADGEFVVAGGNAAGSTTDVLTVPLSLQGSLPARAEVGVPVTVDPSAQGAVPPYRFQVDWGDRATNLSGGGILPHVYAGPGTFDLVVTVMAAAGGSTAANITLVVHDTPLARISASVPGADVGIPVNLTGSVIGGWAPVSYVWQMGDGSESFDATPSYSYGSIGTFQILLTAHDAIGGQAMANLSIEVHSEPTLLLPTTGFAADQGIALSISANLSGGTAPFQVDWKFADGSIAQGAVVVHRFDRPGPSEVLVEAHDAAGALLSARSEVVVAPPLAISMIGPTGLDAGTTGSWESNVTGGTGPYSIAWTVSDGGVSTGPTLRHLFDGTTGSASITVQVTDSVNATASATVPIEVREGGAATPGISLGSTTTLGVLAAAGIICGGIVVAYYRKNRGD